MRILKIKQCKSTLQCKIYLKNCTHCTIHKSTWDNRHFFCCIQCETYILHFKQIHIIIWQNILYNLNKSLSNLKKYIRSILTNTFCNNENRDASVQRNKGSVTWWGHTWLLTPCVPPSPTHPILEGDMYNTSFLSFPSNLAHFYFCHNVFGENDCIG